MIRSPTHIVLLNGHAGGMSGDTAEAIAAQFRSHQIDCEIRQVDARDKLGTAAREAVAQGARVIVAGGGDGTVSTVAGEVHGTSTTLGVLPLGTLNHFAKDIGMPLDVAAAVETICAGKTRRVDVARVNDRLFVNNSSLGLYPRMVRRRDRLVQRLRRRKWPAFLWAAVGVLRRYPFLDITLTVQGESLSCRTPLVFIGNNTYELHGLEVGERRRLDEGRLSIYVVRPVSRLGLLRLALRMLFGRLRHDTEFQTFWATALEVRTRRSSVSVATDGEVNRMRSPLCYQVEAGGLSVIVPDDPG